jgi:hypothetical protein
MGGRDTGATSLFGAGGTALVGLIAGFTAVFIAAGFIVAGGFIARRGGALVILRSGGGIDVGFF